MIARAAFVLLVSVAPGCGGDDSNATSSDTSSGGGSGSTTQSVPSNPSTSGDAASTSSESDGAQDVTGSGSATATGEPSTDSGSEGSSGAASSGSTGDVVTAGSDTGARLDPYGDCSGEALPCPEGSFCLLFPGSGVCTQEGCRDAADCPDPPPGGNAPVACLDANGDDIDDCRIDCSSGELCPTGMECFSDEICIWS